MLKNVTINDPSQANHYYAYWLYDGRHAKSLIEAKQADQYPQVLLARSALRSPAVPRGSTPSDRLTVDMPFDPRQAELLLFQTYKKDSIWVTGDKPLLETPRLSSYDENAAQITLVLGRYPYRYFLERAQGTEIARLIGNPLGSIAISRTSSPVDHVNDMNFLTSIAQAIDK